MTDALPLERFRNLVANYGANPDRWPNELRAGAVGTLVASAAARTAWRDAADLDAALDSVPGADISPQLAERVMAIASPTEAPNPGKNHGVLRYALPTAAAAAVALVVGLSLPSPLREAADPGVANEITVIEPAAGGETSIGLAALALVDVPSDSESGAAGSDSASDTSLLSGLPLL